MVKVMVMVIVIIKIGGDDGVGCDDDDDYNDDDDDALSRLNVAAIYTRSREHRLNFAAICDAL